MPRIIRTPDFSTMNLTAGGDVRTALADEHRVLICLAGYHNFFVIARAEDTDRARQVADELHAEHEGFRRIYLILLTADQLDAIADDVVLNVAVLVVGNDYATAATAIKVHNGAAIELATEQGDLVGEVTTVRDLHAGDFFTCGTQRLGADTTGLAIYRAVADYDPATDAVADHPADHGWRPGTGARLGAYGPADAIVFRLTDRATLLTKLDLDDIQPVTA